MSEFMMHDILWIRMKTDIDYYVGQAFFLDPFPILDKITRITVRQQIEAGLDEYIRRGMISKIQCDGLNNTPFRIDSKNLFVRIIFANETFLDYDITSYRSNQIDSLVDAGCISYIK